MTCTAHKNHEHKHSSTCGHKAIHHDDHIDYLHENHLHHMHGDHIDEHVLSESDKNQSKCTPDHVCASHESGHKHGLGCGHDAIPHENHLDFLVAGHLHHPCDNHCDHHGAVAVA